MKITRMPGEYAGLPLVLMTVALASIVLCQSIASNLLISVAALGAESFPYVVAAVVVALHILN